MSHTSETGLDIDTAASLIKKRKKNKKTMTGLAASQCKYPVTAVVVAPAVSRRTVTFPSVLVQGRVRGQVWERVSCC